MAGFVYAAVSHKGGAGRSTAAANVAYQAANAGNSVCLVDFDLDSATLGSVLGLEERTVGGKLGIQSLLAVNGQPQITVDHLLLDLKRTRFTDRLVFTTSNPGAFCLVPGNAEQKELVSEAEMAPILRDTLNWLASSFDIVIVDVRAGKSAALRSILDAASGVAHFTWLLFYRWTHQHLSAARDMIDTLSQWSEAYDRRRTIIPVATARIAREEVDGQPWFEHQYDALSLREEREIQQRLGRRAHSIPFDRVFQWKEQILCGPRHEGKPATVEAFCELASVAAEGIS
jgi:AAA domain